MLKKIKPKLTSKSGPQISIEPKTGMLPYDQLIDIKSNMMSELKSLAKENSIDHSSLDSTQLINKLKERGVLGLENANLIEATIDVCNSADSKITQPQVNELLMLYRNVQFD